MPYVFYDTETTGTQMRTAEQYSPTEATGFSGFAGPRLDRL